VLNLDIQQNCSIVLLRQGYELDLNSDGAKTRMPEKSADWCLLYISDQKFSYIHCCQIQRWKSLQGLRSGHRRSSQTSAQICSGGAMAKTRNF